MDLLPVILSGGSGSRLWPVSRQAYPKPFVTLPDGEKLIHKTYQRASEIPGVKGLFTITNRDYYFMSKDELADINANSLPTPFILEPTGRNTAPAIALAALMISEIYGPETIMLVLSADHLIQNKDAFEKTALFAAELASQKHLVTFGIKPDKPETGYGYIEIDEEIVNKTDSGILAHRVENFVEKPSLTLAETYVESGCFLWNSGMFCFRADVIINAIQKYAPEIYESAIECFKASASSHPEKGSVTELDKTTFENMPDISIDYAVMEKAEDILVVPSDFGWSDVGCWQSMGEMVDPDDQGNRIDGEAVLEDVKNTYIQSPHRLVAGVGLENLVIIDTEDALLVADRERVQDVKKIVEQLKTMNHDVVHLHRTVVRPWGAYTVLEEGDGFKIKRIVVKAGSSLSLQMHHHRSEHWVVVHGTAKVINGGNELILKENESTFIPAGHKHRLENPGKLDMVLIEVQSGQYLGEDDIVRFDDVYGRC